jgi:hypothetical protein
MELVVRLLAAAALWVRIQTSLKNTKWATLEKEWPTLSSLDTSRLSDPHHEVMGSILSGQILNYLTEESIASKLYTNLNIYTPHEHFLKKVWGTIAASNAN